MGVLFSDGEALESFNVSAGRDAGNPRVGMTG
jgi:hypothetical protein